MKEQYSIAHEGTSKKEAGTESPMKIGVIVPLGELGYRDKPFSYHEIRDRAQQAEELGLDSIWLYDHLLHRFPERDDTVGFWENWTMMSALADATSSASLGTQVLCTPFRNPAVLAKMADTFQEVSNQRLILGLGAGWHKPEFDAFGAPFDHRISRFQESLEIIVPLLREGHVNYNGKYYQAQDCELKPRGSTENGPPIMIAAFGPRMRKLAARFADSWNTDWIGPVESLDEHKSGLAEACVEIGRDPSTLELTGGVTVAYPQLGDLPTWMISDDQYVTGSTTEVANSFQAYADAGVSHIMCGLYPFTEDAVNKLATATEEFRANH